MSTCVFYIDEAGSSHKHNIPLREGQTPIFTLAAVAFALDDWRQRDREFLALKRHYFPDRMNRQNKRDEYVEIKGNELTAPRSADSKRKHAFLRNAIAFIENHSGSCFGVSFLKNAVHPISQESIYTHALQILVERFTVYVDEHPEYRNAILICDSRSKGLSGEQNLLVIKSHMSYIFGHCVGRTCTNILEAPLFADSKLCVGVQLADILASLLYTSHYQYYLNSDPLTKGSGFVDYSHMGGYWSSIKPLLFQATKKSGGYPLYGMKVIDHRPERQPTSEYIGPITKY